MNLEKYRESEMFKKCWEIQRNAEKFREMQRNVDRSQSDFYFLLLENGHFWGNWSFWGNWK